MRDPLLYTVIFTIWTSAGLSLTDCSEEEFREIRTKYEECANQKILNVTELLKNGNPGNSQDMIICEEVQQLINHCGNLLDTCFDLEQIEETKRKQRVGIQNILSKRFSSEQIEECFRNSAQDITTAEIIIQQKADDITDKPTTASQSRPLEKEVFISTTASTTTGHSPTLKVSGDQATTPDPTLPTKCEAEEYQETRQHYEVCASNKIREITAWLERRERRRRSEPELQEDEEKKSILTVCNAVRQLLYDCGNELGWCFTEHQVSETRFKQKAGLEEILSNYYSAESLKMCFVEESLSFAPDLLPSSTQSSHVSKEDRTGPRISVDARRPKFFPTSASCDHSRKTLLFAILSLFLILH